MQCCFESYVRELTHWRVIWPMLPKWRAVGLWSLELFGLLGCLVAYYLLDHDLLAIVAMFGVGLAALGVNHRMGGRWVRTFQKQQGRPMAEGVSYPDLVRELRVEKLLDSAKATGRRPIARVIQIEIESTQSQAEIDKRRRSGLPSWFGKVAASLGTLGLGLIINLPASPVEKVQLFVGGVLPFVASGASVFLMVPRLPSKESQMLDYLSLLFSAKRALDLATAGGDVGGSWVEPSPSGTHRDSAAAAEAPRA